MVKPSLLNNHLREIDFFVIYFFCLQWKILNHFSLTLTHALLTLITWQLSSRHQRRNYRISIRIQFHKDINIQVVLHMEIWQWMNVDRKYLIPNVDLMRFFKDPSSLGSWNLPGYNLFIPRKRVYALVDFSSYCVIFYQKWVWCKKKLCHAPNCKFAQGSHFGLVQVQHLPWRTSSIAQCAEFRKKAIIFKKEF